MLAEKVFFVVFVLLGGNSIGNSEDSDMKLAQAQNHFALKLLKELCTKHQESNIFFSPTSIFVALAMVYAGARGKSEMELSAALGHTAAGLSTRKSILDSYKKILTEQQTDDNVSLMIANAVFVQKNLKVLESYQKELADTFAAMFRSVDVGAENFAMESEINEWVKNKTRGKISGFKIPSDTVVALLNAIYFKGIWKTPFEPKYTSPLPFYNKGSEEVKVETMTRTSMVPITFEPDFEAIELSYKGDGHCMVIILPRNHTSKALAELRDSMTLESIEKIKESLKRESVTIQLPKFHLKTEYGLIPALKKLGVRSIFSDADLSGITGDGGLRVTDVQHKAAIEVNEEGTVAGAATDVVLGRILPTRFFVNRPFLFYIREKATGRVLFLGEVHELPAAKVKPALLV
ncbi:intracellular coagulation inhibitor 3-like [Ixodes scapularis]|uniref:intracellular coagulation inhibitor 3-like n=1 Tax=Ixodes scapularis TaxID=6945 RepID=UPI001A9FC0C1|nr:intracellular coagulation inhibitor 3-like [Ixodes scapularis]